MSRRDSASKNGLFQLLSRICPYAVATITLTTPATSIIKVLPTGEVKITRIIIRISRNRPRFGSASGAAVGTFLAGWSNINPPCRRPAPVPRSG